MWEITSTKSEWAWFDDYVMQIITSAPAPKLPSHEGSLGSTDWFWYSPEPGHYWVQTGGGTLGDRLATQEYVASQLEAFGLQKMAVSWNATDREQVQGKALRLIRTNKVHVHDNMPNLISGTVIGDHGTYQPEIQRDPTKNPRSQDGLISGHCQCILPGGKIVMADGSSKSIEDCEVGDMVLTASGRVEPITHVHVNPYDGQAIWLQPTGGTEGIWVTSNHPVFDDNDRIIDASELNKGDLVFYPQPKIEAAFDINPLEFLDPDEYGLRNNRVTRKNKCWINPKTMPSIRKRVGEFNKVTSTLPAIIPFDHSFARLAGLYLAEGMLVDSRNHKNNYEVRWTFDDEGENHLIQEIQDILDSYGLKSWTEKTAHAINVCCASKPFVKMLGGLFGTGSRGKRIDQRIMQLSQDILEVMVYAWLDGDGYRRNMKVRDGIDTASETLALQLRYLLARTGRESTIRHRLDNASPLVPGGRDIYRVSWRTNGGKGKGRHFFEDNKIKQALTQPDRKQYSGIVYNIEVANEHTYVMAPGIACHNCDWGSFMNTPRTREWKQFQNAPCAHLVALWWLGQSMPLDTGEDEPNPTLQNGQGDISQFEPNIHNPIMNFAPHLPGPNIPGLTPRPDSGTTDRAFGPGGGDMGVGPETGESTGQPSIPPGPEAALPQAQPEPIEIDPNGSVPGKKPPSPSNPIQYPGGTFSSVKESADMPFNEGDMVQLKNDDFGTGVGDAGYAGVGQQLPIPAGTVGEVRGVHAPTGMVEVFYNEGPFLQNGPMQAHGASAWHFPNDLKARPDLRGSAPMIRRT